LVLTNTYSIGARNFVGESVHTVFINRAGISDASSVWSNFALVVHASVRSRIVDETSAIFVLNTDLAFSSLSLASSSSIVAEGFEIASWNWNVLSKVSAATSWC